VCLQLAITRPYRSTGVSACNSCISCSIRRHWDSPPLLLPQHTLQPRSSCHAPHQQHHAVGVAATSPFSGVLVTLCSPQQPSSLFLTGLLVVSTPCAAAAASASTPRSPAHCSSPRSKQPLYASCGLFCLHWTAPRACKLYLSALAADGLRYPHAYALPAKCDAAEKAPNGAGGLTCSPGTPAATWLDRSMRYMSARPSNTIPKLITTVNHKRHDTENIQRVAATIHTLSDCLIVCAHSLNQRVCECLAVSKCTPSTCQRAMHCAGGRASSHASAAKQQLHTPLIRHTMHSFNLSATHTHVYPISSLLFRQDAPSAGAPACQSHSDAVHSFVGGRGRVPAATASGGVQFRHQLVDLLVYATTNPCWRHVTD
jgi:hypothetical protein